MLWYSFSSCEGNLELLRERILSIPKHISNVHKFDGNKFHKSCEHEDLSSNERSKAWLDKEEIPVEKVDQSLHGKDMCRLNDLPHA